MDKRLTELSQGLTIFNKLYPFLNVSVLPFDHGQLAETQFTETVFEATHSTSQLGH